MASPANHHVRCTDDLHNLHVREQNKSVKQSWARLSDCVFVVLVCLQRADQAWRSAQYIDYGRLLLYPKVLSVETLYPALDSTMQVIINCIYAGITRLRDRLITGSLYLGNRRVAR